MHSSMDADDAIVKPSTDAAIAVFQDRDWYGDPRWAVFTVSVDRKRVGTVPLHDRVVVPVTSGEHTVRIRQWWYRSPPLTVEVEPGATLMLRGSVNRSSAGVVKMLFRPWSSLMLERI